jgi:hypothetical protein
MRIDRGWRLSLSLLIAAALIVPALSQQPAEPPATAPATPPKKPKTPKPAVAPGAKPTAAEAVGGPHTKLLGQYGEWGAYSASPSGKKICFAIAKPTSSETVPPNRPRNPVYIFISTRPADKVTNEVSIVIGYPFKPGTETSADIGSTSFALYTQQDGAWIKNAADEASMVTAMRGGDSMVVKGASAKGTQTTDTFTLKGVTQALDRVAQDCQ